MGRLPSVCKQKLLPVEADRERSRRHLPADVCGHRLQHRHARGRHARRDDRQVGSQANRLEPIFKSTGKDSAGKELNPLASLVPQVEIVLHKAGAEGEQEAGGQDEKDAANGTPTCEKRSLLDLAHRSADAVVLASPTLAS